MIELYHGDCLEIMDELIKDGVKVDAIITDPPYNIKKAEWDKWQDKIKYAEWLVNCFSKARQLLKDNGSFYFFHNDFMQIVNIQNLITEKTDYVFKQFIVWNKRYEASTRKYYFDNVIKSNIDRNYRLMAEYILYYTLQDETGFSSVMQYFKGEREKLGWTYDKCDKYLGIKASSCYWDKPTTHEYRIPEEKHYKKLQGTGHYKRAYESVKKEYESLRYTFNNQKTHHSIWNYEIAKKQGHITPKPIDLMENIIKHSTNENDLILDCFMGSGTTGVSCKNLNRSFIGIEKEEKYFKIAQDRIGKQ